MKTYDEFVTESVSETFLRMTDADKHRYIKDGKATDDEKLIFADRASLTAEQKKRRDDIVQKLVNRQKSNR